MLLRTVKAFTFLTWSKSMHGRVCDKLLLQPQDLCNFLSDLLLVLLMSLNDHDTESIPSRIVRTIRESLFRSRYLSLNITGLSQKKVLLPIKFIAYRMKFLLLRAAGCLALIYLIQAFIIHKRTTTFIMLQSLLGRYPVALVKKMCMEFVSTMKLTELDQIRKSSGDFYLIRFFQILFYSYAGIPVEFIWLVVSVHVCSRFETWKIIVWNMLDNSFPAFHAKI